MPKGGTAPGGGIAEVVSTEGVGDYIEHLSSWASDLLARGKAQMPQYADEMRADIAAATSAAQAGDLKLLFDTLWDWEATLDESSLSSLRAARTRFRKRKSAGLAPKKAASSLRRELGG